MFFNKTSDESNSTEGPVQFSMVVFCLAMLAFRAPLPLLPHGFPPMAISTYSTSSTTPSYSLATFIKTTRGLRRLTHEPVAVSTRPRRVVPYVNIPLLSQLAANELLVIGLSSIFPGMNGFQTLAERAHFGLVNVPLGVIAALPQIIINIYLENSEAPVFYNLNLSTELLVARLFGIFSQPVTALAFSVGLRIFTGAAEETLFRGQLLPAFAGFTGSASLAAVTTTFMFAIGHLNLRYPVSWRSSENLPHCSYTLLAVSTSQRSTCGPATLHRRFLLTSCTIRSSYTAHTSRCARNSNTQGKSPGCREQAPPSRQSAAASTPLTPKTSNRSCDSPST